MSRPRTSSTASLGSSMFTGLSPLEPARLEPWVKAIIDYLKAVNNGDWFSADADNREGRLFFGVMDETPGKKIDQAQTVLESVLVGNAELQAYLLESYEMHIQHWLPAWHKTLKHMKTEDLKKLKKLDGPDIKDIAYFYAGRNIIDAFWTPIEQSQHWPFFWEAFSHKFTLASAAALKELIRGALSYHLLLTWVKHIEAPTLKGKSEEHKEQIKEQTNRVLKPLLILLTKTFNDSADFLLQLFKDSIENKKNEPSLVMRIMLTTELDEPALKLVRKTPELPFIERLKIIVGEMRPPSDNDNISNKAPSASLPVLPPIRQRAGSVSTIGVNPSLLLTSTLFLQQQTAHPSATNDKHKDPDPKAEAPTPDR